MPAAYYAHSDAANTLTFRKYTVLFTMVTILVWIQTKNTAETDRKVIGSEGIWKYKVFDKFEFLHDNEAKEKLLTYFSPV